MTFNIQRGKINKLMDVLGGMNKESILFFLLWTECFDGGDIGFFSKDECRRLEIIASNIMHVSKDEEKEIFEYLWEDHLEKFFQILNTNDS